VSFRCNSVFPLRSSIGPEFRLHNRVPAVLKPQAWPAWLGEQSADVPQLEALLAPYPSDDMICWPVSPRVGNVKNNDPSLIERIAVQ
jgi:putative SOS response-associated peptidase YedK